MTGKTENEENLNKTSQTSHDGKNEENLKKPHKPPMTGKASKMKKISTNLSRCQLAAWRCLAEGCVSLALVSWAEECM
jgi:spore germination cell wall hydrolase CwlJ-like protein